MTEVAVKYITEEYFNHGYIISNDCCSISFINNGAANVVIMNAITIRPGESFSFSNNSHLHHIKNTFDIRFTSLTGARLTVIKEFKTIQ